MDSPKFTDFSYYLQIAGEYDPFRAEDLEDEILRMKESHGLLTDSLPIFFLLDYSAAKYVFVNQAFESILGYPGSYILDGGMEFFMARFHPEDLEIFSKKIFPSNVKFLEQHPHYLHKHFLFSHNYRVKDSSGEYKMLLQRYHVIRSTSTGIPLTILGYAYDITHFKADAHVVYTIEDAGPASDTKGSPVLLQSNIYFSGQAISALSIKEAEVLRNIIKGSGSKQIAHIMKISIHTVNNHRKRLLKKTNTKNIADLIRYAQQNGLFSLLCYYTVGDFSSMAFYRILEL